MNINEIMVSIVCITFNHEDYIKDALDGFLEQEVKFRYEILVHDDASTDRTAEIIREYEIKYPDIIHGIYQKENQYSKKNNFRFLRTVYSNCRGKYVAFCEGDDFWIDIHKLQLQVEFLEKHSDYVLTIHNAIRLKCLEGKLEIINPYYEDKEITAEELIMQYNGNLPTASMVMRAEMLKLEDWFWNCGVGDWPTQLYCLTKGKIYYFERIMSVYRSLHIGSWCQVWERDFYKRLEHSIAMVEFLVRYNQYTNYAYKDYIISRIQGYVYTVLEMYSKEEKEAFEGICDRYDRESDGKYQNYLEEIKRIYSQVFDENYCSQELGKFINGYRHIILFGAGEYAEKLAKQLENNDISFDGFGVSEQKAEKKEYLGKPVWQLNNIPFDLNTVGVLVAIKPVRWNQLTASLERNKITEYMCPFLFKI